MRINLGGESVHAEKVSNSRYKILNIPISKELAYEDIVLATEDSLPFFKRVVKRSGNSTLVIKLNNVLYPDNTLSQVILKPLRELGCGFECMIYPYYGCNVPAGTDLNLVDFILKEKKKEEAITEYEWLFRYRKH